MRILEKLYDIFGWPFEAWSILNPKSFKVFTELLSLILTVASLAAGLLLYYWLSGQ